MGNSISHRYRYLRFKDNERFRRFIHGQDELEHHQIARTSSYDASHGPYLDGVLFRHEWITRRKQILTRDQHRCRVCGSTDNLQVHHRQYHFVVRKNKFKLPWEYEDKLLITLCDRCNHKGHSKFKVPTINI